ncbi:O-antigen chain-terminating methyltransferase [Desulfurella multipotens]|uniref:O-antigen chain-terminating methyltransferase n=2 Tax=Desulfurella TaxID=33001 RepID=A0A1G6QVC4_9BACT|nr:methyltransferase domain-containing protein [Desulfurella multipotens]SDC96379.1 O-antigen chain-terminating methyltransferase [Desulfurella multipotens]
MIDKNNIAKKIKALSDTFPVETQSNSLQIQTQSKNNLFSKTVRFFKALVKLSNTRYAVLNIQQDFESFKFFTQQKLESTKSDFQIQVDKLAESVHGIYSQNQEKIAELEQKISDLKAISENRYAILNLKLNQILNNNSQIQYLKQNAPDIDNPSRYSLDDLYVAFESEFRGSEHQVKKKLEVYLPSALEAANKTEDLGFIDLGCGRGEWLELLAQNGLNPIGIDANKLNVLLCKDKSLNAVYGDAFDFLQSQPDNSACGISAFHFIEHIDFKGILNLIWQSYRIIKPGGVLIFETPNIANIFVGFYDFFRDFSHISHIHPETLEFLVRYGGFLNAECFFVTEFQKLIPFKSYKFDTLDDYIKAPRDLALIAHKPLTINK